MDLSTTLAAAPCPAPGATWGTPARFRTAASALIVAILAGAAYVGICAPYTAGSTLGYNLGLVGGVLMLLLLPYSLRKRLRSLRQVGTMRSWFLFHVFAGLLGPLLILFHSTFRIGSFNGGTALVCTLLVTASGAVGRFFYRKVHRGLTGSRATLDELQAALDEQMTLSKPHLERLPAVGGEARRYIALAAAAPAGRRRRAAHFLSLGWQRRVVRRRIERSLPAGREFEGLLRTIDATLATAQRAAQFSIYERLFALWHVIHIPFLYLLVLTAVVHVVAVHAY